MNPREILPILTPPRLAQRKHALAEADRKVDEAVTELNQMNRVVLNAVIRIQHEIEERRRDA